MTDPREFVEKDIRRNMPRILPPHFGRNRRLLDQFNRIAWGVSCTPAQLALTWLLGKTPFVIPIVDTTSIEHLRANVGASGVRLTAEIASRVDALINSSTVSGPRYPLRPWRKSTRSRYRERGSSGCVVLFVPIRQRRHARALREETREVRRVRKAAGFGDQRDAQVRVD